VRLTDSGVWGGRRRGSKKWRVNNEERGFIEKRNTFSNIVKLNTTALI
jgi:hypothetical protein